LRWRGLLAGGVAPAFGGSLILQCYKLSSLAESARCAEPGELTEMERHMQQTAKTLTEIIMSQSDFSFVTL
jgi:hypothetical protein